MENLEIQTNTASIPKLRESIGIDLYNINNPVKINISDILEKLDFYYDEYNDIINIKCKSNLLIESENTIFISKNDTVVISGEALGGKGKIFLNPVLQKFRQIKDFIKR